MNRFPKNERLHSRKQIEALFAGGKSFFVYPFKVIYGITNYELRITGDRVSGFRFQVSDAATNNSQFSILNSQLLIAVPKRRIKKAVRRNLIKRRTREAWRLNKLPVTSYQLPVTGDKASSFKFQVSSSKEFATQHSSLSVILQYVADEPLSYEQIATSVKTIVEQLGAKFKD